MLSAPWATGQTPTVYLALQEFAQAATVPTTNYAPYLLNLLNSIATSLPATSSYLKSSSNYLIGPYGPQLGQEYSQSVASERGMVHPQYRRRYYRRLYAQGQFQNPALVSDVAAINAFMYNPYNYAPVF